MGAQRRERTMAISYHPTTLYPNFFSREMLERENVPHQSPW
jgi:hypothetical protein